MGKVIYERDRLWIDGDRYVVESQRDPGAPWEERAETGNKAIAVVTANALVADNGHYAARVIDTEQED